MFSVSFPSGEQHVPELDGLRAVAIGLVMLRHFTYPGIPGPVGDAIGAVTGGGWIGVDLFFVLSGFLITGICLDNRGRGFFRAFYIRRALRIVPAYALLLGILAFVSLVATGRLPNGFAWMGTFTTNLLMARVAGFGAVPATAAHLWSLAVEEQFYIFWPLIVALLPRRMAFAVAVAAIPLALVVRGWLLVIDGSAIGAHVLMPARADTLAIGAVLAFVVRSSRWPAWRGYARRLGLSNAGLSTLALLVACFAITRPLTLPVAIALRYSELGAFFGVMTASVVGSRGLGSLSRVLDAQPLQWLGTRSYGVYLIHLPVSTTMLAAGLAPRTPLDLVGFMFAATIVTCALAELSWRTIERPALGLKRFARYPGRAGAEREAVMALPEAANA